MHRVRSFVRYRLSVIMAAVPVYTMVMEKCEIEEKIRVWHYLFVHERNKKHFPTFVQFESNASCKKFFFCIILTIQFINCYYDRNACFFSTIKASNKRKNDNRAAYSESYLYMHEIFHRSQQSYQIQEYFNRFPDA